MAEDYHIPVLMKQSVDALNICDHGVFVDTTFGGGGHSKEILRRLQGKGILYGFDQDLEAYENFIHERDIYGDIDSCFQFVRSNFRFLKNFLRYYGVQQVDGILADLGVSSHHFDSPERGFSFRFEAPLDMRMNQDARTTAADVLNNYDEKRLADIFFLYGEMKNSRKVAEAVARKRKNGKFQNVGDLIAVLEPFCKQQRAKKDMAKAFQALRIEVNQEMQALKEMLNAAKDMLRPGGRLVVITYHSLEDRIVKNMMRTGNCQGDEQKDFYGNVISPFTPVNRKVVTPDEQEMLSNPRSRSAKLRVAERNPEPRSDNQ